MHTDAAGAIANQLALISQRVPRRKSVMAQPTKRENWYAGVDKERQTRSWQDTKALLQRLSVCAKKRDADGYLRMLRYFQTHGMLYLLREYHFLVGMRLVRPLLQIPADEDWREGEMKGEIGLVVPSSQQKVLTPQGYAARMRFLMQLMRNANIKPSLESYFLVLEQARFTRHTALANTIWQEILESGITPDVFCYNAYIATLAVPREVFDRFRMRKRKEDGSVVASREKYLAAAETASRKAVVLYQEMVKRGLQSNSFTVELLILALGRAGNLAAARSIIKQTWGLTVADAARNWLVLEDEGVADELDEEGIDTTGADDASLPEPRYNAVSPLFPTEKTLLAIGTAFGIHHQTGLALELISQFAKVYDTPVTTRVIANIMQFALADSERNGGFTDRMQVQRIFEASQTLFDLAPDQSMYAVAINAEIRQDRYKQALDLLEAMLASLESGTLPLYKVNADQARHIVRSTLFKIHRRMAAAMRRQERRVQREESQGGDHAIRLAKEWLERQRAFLKTMRLHWSERLETHLTRMGTFKAKRRAMERSIYHETSASGQHH
jgi:hypothetical protein